MRFRIFHLISAMIFANAIVGCGGGGGATAGSSNAPNPSTTALIQSNLTLNYSNEQINLARAIQACQRQWGASSNTTICGVAAKQTSVQNFLSTAISNIRYVKSVGTLDKPAIGNLLTSYQVQDLAWLKADALSSAVLLSQSEINALMPSYSLSVNTSYSNAFLQLSGI